MEKSEPSLVPEWLRSHGSSTGGGSSSHHFASSQDGPLLALPKNNRSSKSTSNYDAPRSSFLDRSLSSSSRRSSSSNGSSKSDKNLYSRSYSNFTRNHRDREKERLSVAESWDAEYSDPLKSISGRIRKDTLKRSQSMVQRKQAEVSQRRVVTDLRNSGHNHLENGTDSFPVGSSASGIHKVSFERDFPSLGSEDRPTTPDINRVPSPGLTKGVQSLSIGNSPLVGGEGWTSVLAEVPVGVGSNSLGSSPALQPVVAASASSSGSASTMAEALVQASPRSQATTQPTIQTQRLEELAVYQSMRLIPMTPTVPKASVLNPSDKLKPKTAARSGEPVATKNVQPLQQLTSLQVGNQSIRGGNAKADAPKPSHPKLVLSLKQGRENGVSAALKDVSSPSPTSNTNNKVGNGQITGVLSAPLPLKTPNNTKLSALERKTPAYGLNPGSMIDKKSAQAQAQSRNDFFNMMRKKSMNSTSVNPESGTSVSSVGVEKPDEQKVVSSAPASTSTKYGIEVNCNGEAGTVAQKSPDAREHVFCDDACIPPEDEEARFLRSLGWEENAADEGGLTEEEINAFYDEVYKMKPNWVPTTNLCQGLKKKLLTKSQRQAASSDEAASESNAADSSKSED